MNIKGREQLRRRPPAEMLEHKLPAHGLGALGTPSVRCHATRAASCIVVSTSLLQGRHESLHHSQVGSQVGTG